MFCPASCRTSLLILLHADLGTQYVSKLVLKAVEVGSVPKASKRASSVKMDILQRTKRQYLKLGPHVFYFCFQDGNFRNLKEQ